LAYPPMVLKDFQNDKLRSSRAPVPCPKGLFRLILGAFWDPCWGQVGVKMDLFCMLMLISKFDPSWKPSWGQHGPNLGPKRGQNPFSNFPRGGPESGLGANMGPRRPKSPQTPSQEPPGDRFWTNMGPKRANLRLNMSEVGTQMGSKSVLKPLPTWTCIRCCF